MAKMRVYELAKELGVESKVLITRAKTAGITEAKSHQSTLEDDAVATLKAAFTGGEAPKASSKKPKTVIRRRRKVGEEDDGSDAEDSPAVAAESATTS